ncbi:MAG: glycosyltransferase [Hydrogenophaga sp.]|uniref:glycosyltransferase family protein n=1 Tax=Hydrogenophaga sp. TaxID=1904254 RepID=UPI002607D5DB|nr:glycosyltransferase [Hydrogenophaga sp.]MCV0439780.1 glycosyltransferase [Hydrogenophaga sp.]
MKILVSYRGIPQSPGWATGDMVVKAFRELGHEAYPYAKYYQENRWVEGRPLLDEQDWDLILFMECNDGDPQYPELKITRARKTACWLFDTSYHADRYKRLVDYFRFDHLFLANPLTIQEYKLWGYENVSYLPYACDRELHGRSLEYPKTRDVVLVGSIRDDRRHLAAALSRLGVELELVGDVFREDYIDALASAKIVINQNPDAGRGLLNMRYWEAPAAGSFVLTEAADYSEQPIDLNNGFPYNDTEELALACQSFLEHEDRLTQVTALCQKNVIANHTYTSRCQAILTTIFPHHA